MRFFILAMLLLFSLSACAEKQKTDAAMYYGVIDSQVKNQKAIADKFSSTLTAVANQSDTIGDNVVVDRERTLRTQAITTAIEKASEMIHIDIAAPAGFVFYKPAKEKFPDELNLLPNKEDEEEKDNYDDVRTQALLKLNGG